MLYEVITIAASVNQVTVNAGQNPAEYQQYLDIINLMTYDMHGAFERVTNHHSAIYPNPNDPSEEKYVRETFNAQAAAVFFASFGIPKSKINIGTPWYSRGWGGVSVGPNGNGLFQTATGYVRGTRITSYNVCYTKLLRLSRKLLPFSLSVRPYLNPCLW